MYQDVGEGKRDMDQGQDGESGFHTPSSPEQVSCGPFRAAHRKALRMRSKNPLDGVAFCLVAFGHHDIPISNPKSDQTLKRTQRERDRVTHPLALKWHGH